jgi:flagellar motor switch protein FliN/FliY
MKAKLPAYRGFRVLKMFRGETRQGGRKVTDVANQDSGMTGSFDAPGGVSDGNLNLPNFKQAIGQQTPGKIELLRDVDLNVKIELGRTKMLVEDVLKLGEGSVVELDKLAGDPVDVYVNDQLVARGEVLVLNDNFCVRINEIITTIEE